MCASRPDATRAQCGLTDCSAALEMALTPSQEVGRAHLGARARGIVDAVCKAVQGALPASTHMVTETAGSACVGARMVNTGSMSAVAALADAAVQTNALAEPLATSISSPAPLHDATEAPQTAAVVAVATTAAAVPAEVGPPHVVAARGSSADASRATGLSPPTAPTVAEPTAACAPPAALPAFAVPPQPTRPWAPNDSSDWCARCSKRFLPLIRNRHHCRACGHLVCSSCSQRRLPLPDLAYTAPVRVCTLCCDTRQRAMQTAVASQPLLPSVPALAEAASSASVSGREATMIIVSPGTSCVAETAAAATTFDVSPAVATTAAPSASSRPATVRVSPAPLPATGAAAPTSGTVLTTAAATAHAAPLPATPARRPLPFLNEVLSPRALRTPTATPASRVKVCAFVHACKRRRISR